MKPNSVLTVFLLGVVTALIALCYGALNVGRYGWTAFTVDVVDYGDLRDMVDGALE